ncbi:MAG: shikimate dehydrogenase [Candidatus Eisenbacteria bacterium]
MRLAVLGDPLVYTRSPELHRAGLVALGLECESVALRTPADSLASRLRELAAAGFTGTNLTHPLKEPVLALLAQVSPEARAARSVNTVGFEPAGAWGETTDGAGFLDLLKALGRDAAAERVVLHGSGGASRSLALALAAGGCCSVVVASREPARAASGWEHIAGARLELAGGDGVAAAHREATLIVNATPRSTATDPVIPAGLPRAALLMDLTYGPEPTAWVVAARAAGREAMDGLGLLVHQARRSLMRWTGREVPIEPLARAVGWPQ